MVVQVRLFATFREGRFKEKEMDFPDGCALADILAHLKITEENARILLVNGVSASPDHRPAQNDVISIFPPMAGG